MSDVVWEMIAVERLRLADLFESLSYEQCVNASLCDGWTVRDVAAHLVFPFRYSKGRLALKIAANRFSFDKMAFEEARLDRRTVAEFADVLRTNCENRFRPPGLGPEAPLTDCLVHGQDIRRPLGISYCLEEDRARTILDFLVTPKATRGFVAKHRLEELSFKATDLDWSHGSGSPVEGKAEAIILAMVGRLFVLSELSGRGVGMLESRPPIER